MLREMVYEEVHKLRILSPDYADRIYEEIKPEANVYGYDEAFIRLKRVNRLLSRGLEPELILEAVKQHKDYSVELAISLY